MIIKYFVSYAHSKGVGNAVVDVDFQLDCAENVEILQRTIMEKTGFEQVTIMFFFVISSMFGGY